MTLREELAEKIEDHLDSITTLGGGGFTQETIIEMSPHLAGFILSPECLKMLVGRYEVDYTKLLTYLMSWKTFNYISQDQLMKHSKALSKSDVIKVKGSDEKEPEEFLVEEQDKA